MRNKPDTWEASFDKLFTRIEKTRTGHVSGRSIWDADTEGNDDEGNYLFIDESIKRFIRSLIAKDHAKMFDEKALDRSFKRGFESGQKLLRATLKKRVEGMRAYGKHIPTGHKLIREDDVLALLGEE